MNIRAFDNLNCHTREIGYLRNFFLDSRLRGNDKLCWNKINKLIKSFHTLIIISFLLIGCTQLPQGVVTNQLPDTHLSLIPDSIISPQKTRLKISWWGDDPDGLVKGFRFSFDNINWSFTPNNDSTFFFIILGNDSLFNISVTAVDDKGGIDPTPATGKFPILNSPPSISFNSGTELPDTSFTIASFAWTATDPDGDNTVKSIYWSLNDTNNWHRIPSSVSLLTINLDSGIVPNSNNKFYIKAEDLAGAFSSVRKMPDSSKTWFVRQPVGHILVIDDYPSTILDYAQADAFYNSGLTGHQFSKLDIKVANGTNIPRIKNPMFIETMKLFQCVVWYGGRGNGSNDNTNFDLAQQTLPYYSAAGGKVFFTTGFPNLVETPYNIANFAPIDSVSLYQQVTMTIETPVIVKNSNYDTLYTGPDYAPDRVRSIYPRPGANVIYKMPFQTNYPPNDTITVCVKDINTNPKFVFMSVPLHRMNSFDRGINFLKRVIEIDFGVN